MHAEKLGTSPTSGSRWEDHRSLSTVASITHQLVTHITDRHPPVPPGVRWVMPTQHSHIQTHPGMEHLKNIIMSLFLVPLHPCTQPSNTCLCHRTAREASKPSCHPLPWDEQHEASCHPITSTRCSLEEGGIPASGLAPPCQDSTDLYNHTRFSGYFISAVMRLCKPLKAKCFLLL